MRLLAQVLEVTVAIKPKLRLMFYEDERCGGLMSSSNPNTDTVRSTRRNNTAGFVVLIALAVALAAFALYKGQAPIRTPFPEDWIIWARGTPT